MNKKDEAEYQEAIELLNDLRMEDAEQWGLFFLGTQIYIGKTRVYASYQKANNRLQDYLGGGHLYRTPKEAKLVKKLEESGMLEIRKIGDRSPKFPRNKVGLEAGQAERLESMLDASDDEMVNLAITVLQAIK